METRRKTFPRRRRTPGASAEELSAEDFRALVARGMSEAELLAKVRQLARLHGWKTYHPLRSRGSEHGWPDAVLLRPPWCLFVELKAERGRLSAAQTAWLSDLAMATERRVGVWRPSDWPMIERTLTNPDAEIGRTM